MSDELNRKDPTQGYEPGESGDAQKPLGEEVTGPNFVMKSPDENKSQENAEGTEPKPAVTQPLQGEKTMAGGSAQTQQSQGTTDSSYAKTRQTTSTGAAQGTPRTGENPGGAKEEPPHYSYYQTHPKSGGSQTSRDGLPPYPNPGAPKKEPKKKTESNGNGRKFGITVAMAVVFGLVAGLVFQGVNVVSDRFLKEETSQTQIAKSQALPDKEETTAQKQEGSGESKKGAVTTAAGNTVADVAEVGMPSVVAITSVSMQEIPSYFGRFFGYGDYQQYPTTGSGSGIIVGENDNELLIATNKHVVTGATTISVCFMGGDVLSAEEETTNLASGNGDLDLENAVTGKLKGESSDQDLAVVAVNKSDIPEETRNQIKIAQLGDSDQLVVGEQVVAIGNALGFGQSVTSGYVSALNRSISTEDGSTNDSLIQTDAAINPGNSGGALLNMKGEVIGINSAKYADNAVEGMGYAIPIGTAKPILEDLMNRETRDKVSQEKASYLGVTVIDLTSEMIQIYDLPEGAFVETVTEGSPAEKAGLKKGDVIATLDGQNVKGKTGLVDMLQYYEAGETVKMDIYRSDDGEFKKQTLEVKLGKKADSELATDNSTQDSQQSPAQEEFQGSGEEGVPSIDDFFDYFG